MTSPGRRISRANNNTDTPPNHTLCTIHLTVSGRWDDVRMAGCRGTLGLAAKHLVDKFGARD